MPRPSAYVSSLSVKVRTKRVRMCSARRFADWPAHRPWCHPPASLRSTGKPLSWMRHAPTASKFSSASPIGSIILWHAAQLGSSDALPVAPAPVRASPSAVLLQRRYIRRRRGRRRAQNRVHHPLPAHHRRRPVRDRRDRQNAPLPQQPDRFGSVSSTRRNRFPIYSECHSAGPAAHRRTYNSPSADPLFAVLAYELSKNSSVSRRIDSSRFLSKSGYRINVRLNVLSGSADTATDRRNSPPARLLRGSASMRRSLIFQHPRIL